MTNVNALKKVFVACGGSESDFSASTIVEGLKLIFTQLGGEPSALASVDTTAEGIANLAEVMNGVSSADAYLKVLVTGTGQVESMTFSGDIDKIRPYAFYQISTVVKEMDFSNCPLTSIGGCAFYGMYTLENLKLPTDSDSSDWNGYAIVGARPFDELIIESIDLRGAYSLCSDVFTPNCPITTVYLSTRMNNFGVNAFDNSQVTDIYYTGTEEQWSSITGLDQAGIPSSARIHYNWTPTD